MVDSSTQTETKRQLSSDPLSNHAPVSLVVSKQPSELQLEHPGSERRALEPGRRQPARASKRDVNYVRCPCIVLEFAF